MNRILTWIFPSEAKFFDLLTEQSNNVLECSKEFCSFVEELPKLSREKKVERVKKIKEMEKKGDKLCYETIETLDKTFITPLDREDIHRLILLLDDHIDMVKDVSNKLVLYNINEATENMMKLNLLILEGAKEINLVISKLKSLKDLNIHVENINKIEEKADSIYNKSLSNLFNNDKDAIHVMKFSDLYHSLEIITDKAKEIGNIVWNVGVKHA